MLGKSVSLVIVGFVTGVLTATLAFALVLRGQQDDSQPTAGHVVLKLAHTLDESHPVHLAMEDMARRLEEKSAGTVTIAIAANGQLGSETECVELVQRGALAMTKVSTAPLESFVPEMAVFGLPYLFRNEDHFWKVLQSDVGRELLVAGATKGLHGLCYYDAGARSFYTVDRPILQPDDLQGLKIRVQASQTAMQMVRALGGSPTPVSFGELYTSLQQGQVDGAENNPPSFTSTRHYEVCKHYSLNEHTRTPDILLVSQKWWDQLTPAAQRWLTEAAAESTVLQRQLWREQTAESLAEAEANGVTIYHPDQQPFAEQVADLLDSHRGTLLGELIRRIQAVE